jgi:hypothetical protein
MTSSSKVTVEITGVDEDVAEKAFRASVDTLRSINERINVSIQCEPHDDTRGVFGMFIFNDELNTAGKKQDFIKAVKSVVTNNLSATSKAIVYVKLTNNKGE